MKKHFLLLYVSCFLSFKMNAQSCVIEREFSSKEIDCINNTITLKGTLSTNCSTTFDMDAMLDETYSSTSSFILLNANSGYTFTSTVNNLSTTFTTNPAAVNDNIIDFETVISATANSSDLTDKIVNLTLQFNDLPMKDHSVTGTSYSLGLGDLTPAGSINGSDNIDVDVSATYDFANQSGVNYTWSSDPSATFTANNTAEAQISWNTKGYKNISLKIKNGVCAVSYQKIIFVNSPVTAINDLTFSAINVTNPVQNNELILSATVEDIKLFSLTGLSLLEAKNKDRVMLNLPPGLYLLSLNHKIQKLVIE